MFKKEKIINTLKERIYNDEGVDWNHVVNTYEEKDGFYIFNVECKDGFSCGFLFIENTLIDCMPGYSTIKKMK